MDSAITMGHYHREKVAYTGEGGHFYVKRNAMAPEVVIMLQIVFALRFMAIDVREGGQQKLGCA